MKIITFARANIASFFMKAEPISIDFGSAQTRVFLGKKEVFNQPTCIAVHTQSESVIAIGAKALGLLGKVPDSVTIAFPILYGEVAHPRYLELFTATILDEALKQFQLQKYLFGIQAKIAMPNSLSPAKKSILQRVLKSVGCAKIECVGSGFAVAQYIAQEKSSFKDVCVLDIGAQKAEISIFSLGELLHSQSYKWGGVFLTEYLQNKIRSEHHCVVSWHVAESVKKQISTIVASKEKIAVRGKDLSTQASKTVLLDAVALQQDFLHLLDELLDNIMQFLSLLPSEVAVSVLDKGMYLTGGTSKIHGIEQAVMERFKSTVHRSQTPELDVIIGLVHTK